MICILCVTRYLPPILWIPGLRKARLVLHVKTKQNSQTSFGSNNAKRNMSIALVR